MPAPSETVASYDIPGGVIEIDEVTRLPTGILKERAVELVTANMQKFKSNSNRKQFIVDGLNLCMKYGLTSVQTNDEASVHIYQTLQHENSLLLRVFLTPNFNDFKIPASEGGIQDMTPVRPECLKIRKDSTSQLLSTSDKASKLIVERVKLFADGSLGAETAAIRNSAPSIPSMTSNGIIGSDYTGVLIQEDAELVSMVKYAKDRDFRVEVHAIGDKAAECVLNAFSSAQLTPFDRPVLTHCQILWSDLIERMSRSGVVADIQPSFVPTDMMYISERLPLERQKYAYAWKTLLNNDIIVAGGSDSPIETANPFIGLYDAIFRMSRNSSDVFKPEERLSFSQALWTYTVGASTCSKTEDVLGQIKEGYIADLTIVDAKILSDHSLLKSVRPSHVIIGGQIVYQPDKESVATASRTSPLSMDGPYAYGKSGMRPLHEPQWTMNTSKARSDIEGSSCACHLLSSCI